MTKMIKRKRLYNFRESNYQFPTTVDLLCCWMNTFYKDKVVVYFGNCSEQFNSQPVLAILKRDDLNTYLNGIVSKHCIVLFESLEEAQDFVYTLPKTECIIFNRGEIVDDGKRRLV